MGTIRSRVSYFCRIRLFFEHPVWKEEIQKRSDYTGEEQQRAVPLRWAELEPGFPAPEFCARLDATSFVSEDVKTWVENPGLMVLESTEGVDPHSG